MANPPPTRFCRQHPTVAAGWHCAGCQAELCPDCVFTTAVTHVVSTSSCCRCAGQVTLISRSRKANGGFAARLPSVLRYPFSGPALLSALALGTVMYTVQFLGLIGALVAAGAYWSYMFSLIRASARGSAELEAPEFIELWSDMVMPAVAGFVGTAVVWIPGLLYWVYLKDGTGSPLQDPTLWAIAIAGVVYMPMALMAAATNSGILRMLNPVYMLGYIKRLGADYALAVAAIVGLCFLTAVVTAISVLVTAIPLPIIPGILGASLRVLVPFMMARVLGLLLFVRGGELGLGIDSDYLDPILPGVAPRGVPNAGSDPSSSAAFNAARWAPIEIEAGPDDPKSSIASGARGRAHQPTQQAPIRSRPRSLDPKSLPPLMATSEEASELIDDDPIALAKAIAAAVSAGNMETAVQLYLRAELRGASVSPECHLAVGQEAAARGDLFLSISALKLAAESPVDRIASKACVLLARVYGEKLGDLVTAEKIYRHVLRKFPGSFAAQFAQSRIGASA